MFLYIVVSYNQNFSFGQTRVATQLPSAPEAVEAVFFML